MEIALYNRQRKLRFDLAWQRRVAALALVKALKFPNREAEQRPLEALEEVEVTFVSDAVIAKVHVDFMAIPGATDVITFAHGEIIISVETAQENAALFSRPLDEEIARYVVHGLLHLNGYEDGTQEEADLMHGIQEKILSECLRQMGVS